MRGGKRVLFLLVLTGVMLLCTRGVLAYENVSNCTTLSSDDETYIVNDSITSSGNCITINASNVILDCNGFQINFTNSTSPGIAITGYNQNNVTIKNCILWQENASVGSSSGIDLQNMSNLTIYNNTINISSEDSASSCYGIYLRSGTNYTNVSHNNVYIMNGSNYGIYIKSTSYYHNITNNYIELDGNSTVGLITFNGLILDSEIINNTINSNVDGTPGKSHLSILLYLGNLNNSLIKGNNITSNGSTGEDIINVFVYYNSGNNTIRDNRIKAFGVSYSLLYINSSLNYIYNNIFNASATGIPVGAWSNFPNYWSTTKTLATNIIGGSYIGGNYWATTSGAGLSESSTCTNTNSDFICDSSYTLAPNNIDYLPLTLRNTTTTTTEETTTDTTSSGGSSSASPPTSSLESGYTTNFRKSFKMNIGDNTLEVKNLQGNTATIEIANQEYSINENEDIKIDTDNDGYYDVQISAGNVNDIYATLTVQTIYEEIPASEQESQTEEVSNYIGSPSDKFKNSKAFWITIIIAGLILVGFAGYSIYKKKK